MKSGRLLWTMDIGPWAIQLTFNITLARKIFLLLNSLKKARTFSFVTFSSVFIPDRK